MVINKLLEIDYLEKKVIEHTQRIHSAIENFEKEYQQYLDEVSADWAPYIFEIEQKYEVVKKRQDYKTSGINAYPYSVAMFNAMSHFCNMTGQRYD